MCKKLRKWYSLEKIGQIFSIALGMSAIVGILLAWQVFGVDHPRSHLTQSGPWQERRYEESTLLATSNGTVASYVVDFKREEIGTAKYLVGASEVSFNELFKGLIRLEDLPKEFREELIQEEMEYLVESQPGYVGYPIAYNEYPSRIPLEVLKKLSEQTKSDWKLAHTFIEAFKEAEVYVTKLEIKNEGDGPSGEVMIFINPNTKWNSLDMSENLSRISRELLRVHSLAIDENAFLFIGSKNPLDFPGDVSTELQNLESEVVDSNKVWIAVGIMTVLLLAFISLDIVKVKSQE